MNDYDYPSPSFKEPHWRWRWPWPWSATETADTCLASVLLATAIGAFSLLKALEIAGYPVWLWVHRLVRMSLGALPLQHTSLPGFGSDTDEDPMQRASSMLSSIDGLLRRGVRGITGALSTGPSNVPPGLGNISNSCYQNSVIQALAALPSLRDYLSHLTTKHPAFSTDTTNGALHELITKLNDPENHGRNFWIPGKLKSMSTFTQQDAQEYYSKILDELDVEVKKASSSRRRSSVSLLASYLPPAAEGRKASEDNHFKQDGAASEQLKIVPNPLDGLLTQRVGCTTCGYSEGLSMIPFNCITVSLGPNNFYDIRDCLDEYTELEYIDGVECAKCTLLKLQKTLTPLAEANPGSPFEDRLNHVLEIMDDDKFEDNTLVKTLNIPKKNWTQSSKSKQIVVARAPKSLVLHVNRSIFDENTGAQYKNTASVSYPRLLDLGKWCLGSSPSGSRQPDMSLEEWPRDPKQSMLAENWKGTYASSFEYRLRAVVTHAGTHGYGHYVCYRPHVRVATQSEECQGDVEEPQGEQWWRFSDDSVYPVSELQAHQDNVFMLFYERLDEPVSSQPPEAEPVLEVLPVAADAPLPPGGVHDNAGPLEDDEVAAAVPLPDDDELFGLIAPEWPHTLPQSPHPYPQAEDTTSAICVTCSNPPSTTPTPDQLQGTVPESTSHDMETEMSEAESEDGSSTKFTCDFEAEHVSHPTPRSFVPMPPHVMRTAGNAATRGQGSRQSLPMVSAT